MAWHISFCHLLSSGMSSASDHVVNVGSWAIVIAGELIQPGHPGH